MAGDLATIVPKRFAHLPHTRQKVLESPSITQSMGLVWVPGDPVFPMTKTIESLMRQALANGLLEESSFLESGK